MSSRVEVSEGTRADSASSPDVQIPRFPDEIIWTLGRGELTVSERRALGSRLTDSLDSGVPPSEMVSSLAAHGLLPLAYRHLIAAADVDLPDALRAEISAEFRRHTLTRFRYTRRLRDLLDVLDDAGVDAVPYKGPALAVQLFGNFAMRQFGDLDILVRPSDAGRAQQALLDAGLIRHRKATEGWDDYLHRVRHSSELRDVRESVVIELHWSLADRFLGMDVGVDWLLEECETIQLLGRPTRVMSSERLLLALCLHGARHLWERAVWLAEVAEIVRRPGYVNWDRALERADSAGLGRALRACLILARDLLGAAPPSPWQRALDTDLNAVRLSEMLAERLTVKPTGRLQNRFRLGYLAQTTAARRARFCWRVATDLSERDMRSIGPRAGSPLVHGFKRTLRLARLLRQEKNHDIW
ncbi:MAG: nucleotidyltransferase family protein [Vicinamibacterales bacterium]